jgi:hypothetical protein
MPQRWNELWKMLLKSKDASIGLELNTPLILAAWHESSDEEKACRLKEHLIYSEKVGLIDKVETFLFALNESHWYHSGD